MSVHTDSRLGESDIQVNPLKRMKNRVLELKEIYPATLIRKIWSNKMLIDLYILEGFKQKPMSNSPGKCSNEDCNPRNHGSYAIQK